MWLLKFSSFRFDDFYLLLSQWFFINLWPRYFRFLFNFIHEEVKMMHAEVNQHAMNACGPPSSSSQIIHFVKIILDVLRCAQYVLLHLRPFPFLVLSTQQRKTLSKWNNDLSKQNYHFMNSNKEKDSFYRYNQKMFDSKVLLRNDFMMLSGQTNNFSTENHNFQHEFTWWFCERARFNI